MQTDADQVGHGAGGHEEGRLFAEHLGQAACRRFTVGSSPKTSSPTSASAMQALMPGVGRVTVSLRKSRYSDGTTAFLSRRPTAAGAIRKWWATAASILLRAPSPRETEGICLEACRAGCRGSRSRSRVRAGLKIEQQLIPTSGASLASNFAGIESCVTPGQENDRSGCGLGRARTSRAKFFVQIDVPSGDITPVMAMCETQHSVTICRGIPPVIESPLQGRRQFGRTVRCDQPAGPARLHQVAQSGNLRGDDRAAGRIGFAHHQRKGFPLTRWDCQAAGVLEEIRFSWRRGRCLRT